MDEARDTLYDAYLDAASAGRAEAPEAYLRRHGVHDGDLLDALRSIHAQASRSEGHGAEDVAARGLADAEREQRAENWIGEFDLIRKLGEGGMGVVWLATQRSLGRVVAVKLLRADARLSAGAAERLTREARAVAKLRHAGIVAIHAMGEAVGSVEGASGRFAYIAMEHVEGRGLDEILGDAKREAGGDQVQKLGGRIPPARVIRWGAALARALHAAHEVGIVHRDVKPSNVRIGEDDAPKLLDFGLARDVASTQATISDAFVGSPFYAAPEQVARAGGAVDGRTDVYGLGCVLYEALTGRTAARGETLEQVLRSILVDEVASPRAINPAVSKDLATVVLKALEKEPARRYASAHAFAEDLEAILELRAISARPATAWERARRWARRNRGLAAGLTTATAAGLVFAGVLVHRSGAEARARREEAARLIASASAGIDTYGRLAERMREAEVEYAQVAPERGVRFFTDADDASLAELSRRVESVRREREGVFESAQVDLARAERLGASTREVQRARARWYVAAALDAETRGDAKRRETFADLARAHDVDGEAEAALVGTGSLLIVSEPAGVEVFLYRRPMLEQREGRDEPRRGLMPVRGWGSAAWSSDGFVLRVVRGSGEVLQGATILEVAGFGVRDCVLVAASRDARIARFDRLLRVDGEAVSGDFQIDALVRGARSGGRGATRVLTLERRGAGVFDVASEDIGALGLTLKEPDALVREAGVPIRVWTDEGAVDATSGDGLETRTSAVAVPLVATAFVGKTPTPAMTLEPGAYVAVLRHEGRELTRYAGVVGRHEPTAWHVELAEAESAPEGFVLVQRSAETAAARDAFWIMEREVTCREYFEFLNDPEVRERAAASTKPVLYPRDGDTARGQRDAAGRFLLPEGWEWDWPVLFVSWHDARAYADWRTERARREGRAQRFSLPTHHEWARAASAAPGDQYVFGPEFRPKWVSSCFARPRPDPEATMRFPIDESVLGVFDMAGSASEWSEDVYREGYAYRRYMGGAWGTGDPAHFTVYGGNGLSPERVGGMIGFRLVMRRDAKVAGAGVDAAGNRAKPLE